VLGLYGAEDAAIKPEQIKDMEARLKAAGKTAQFHVFDGAPHGFHADYRESYREQAAKQGWAEMTAWFKKYGVLT
jgi:carboxymethylenebutenolidase